MKTLLITAFFPPQLGGLEHYWASVAARWPDRQLIVLTPPGPLKVQSDDRGVRVFRRNFFPWPWIRPSWLPLLWTIRAILKKENCTRILFGHFATYTILGPILKRLTGIEYDLMSHGNDLVNYTRGNFGLWVLRRVLRGARRVYANSEQTQALLRSHGAHTVQIAPPAIAYSAWPELSRSEARRQLNIPDSSFLILFLGRIEPIKGVDTLLRAYRLLPDRSNVILALLGDGSERVRLQRYARLLDFPENLVRFVGAIPDRPEAKAPWLAAANTLVLPSRQLGAQRESFGLVCLEAARYRIPVVVTSVSGAKEFVVPGETGYVVPPEDPKELAKAFETLQNHAELSSRMGEKLFTEIQSRYTWDRTVSLLANTND